jgi:hypothetical protein
MSERRQVAFLRASYWVGATFDALVLIAMLSPQIGGVVFGIPNFNPGNDYKYAMSVAASLMVGWVFLLVWADRKPVERKGVLLLTIFPVLVGLIFSGIYAVMSSFVVLDKMLPTWIMQGLLVLLFGFSYLNARKLTA